MRQDPESEVYRYYTIANKLDDTWYVSLLSFSDIQVQRSLCPITSGNESLRGKWVQQRRRHRRQQLQFVSLSYRVQYLTP